jgi:tetratricopeptide (TPR) repeat protein
MVFDKTKAMRNAERHLAQGKIQSAIGELKQVVANDPKDFGTLNMLGDLYTKNSEKALAVKCYTSVAEHYGKQGFAQKAIAVYNKISKLQPGSIELSAKLAELYRFKGSINEARSHYKVVAEHYESQGKKIEALEIRKEIAALDPTDTAIQLTLAAAYLEEGQSEHAAEAFVEAGNRLVKKSNHPDAVAAFEKALDLTPSDQKALAGFTQAHFALGTASTAAERLAQIHTDEPHNRDVLLLLIDCHIEAGNTVDAEKAVVSLIEREPANYPKLVELAKIHLKTGDVDSASRLMAMASEHLLMAGEAEEFQSLLNDIIALDPENLEGIRQRARLSAWQRDEAAMHDSLADLARVAKLKESIEDERYALSQLVMIAPHEVAFAERLCEINQQFGFDESYVPDNLFDKQFLKAAKQSEPELETFASDMASEENESAGAEQFADFAIVGTADDEGAATDPVDSLDTDEARLLREVDSIRFYIDSGYLELAEKAIGELRSEFGESAEVDDLSKYLAAKKASENEGTDVVESNETFETVQTIQVEMPVAPVEVSTNGHAKNASSGFGIDDLRSELGIDEPDASSDSDYDTHYHTAVAYQEMGLLDEAIKEFQDAVSLVQPNDPTRRFFQCANLIGHCFMQKSMPHLALKWFQRALETPGLGDEEKQGIWYELALAHEAEGDLENAGRYFEQVYAENIDFRDVSQRVKNIAISR